MVDNTNGLVIHRCNFGRMGENYDINDRLRQHLNDLGREDLLAAAMLGPILEAQEAQRDAFGFPRCQCWLNDDGSWDEKGCEIHGEEE